jgi:hypothetical protein
MRYLCRVGLIEFFEIWLAGRPGQTFNNEAACGFAFPQGTDTF